MPYTGLSYSEMTSRVRGVHPTAALAESLQEVHLQHIEGAVGVGGLPGNHQQTTRFFFCTLQ